MAPRTVRVGREVLEAVRPSILRVICIISLSPEGKRGTSDVRGTSIPRPLKLRRFEVEVLFYSAFSHLCSHSIQSHITVSTSPYVEDSEQALDGCKGPNGPNTVSACRSPVGVLQAWRYQRQRHIYALMLERQNFRQRRSRVACVASHVPHACSKKL